MNLLTEELLEKSTIAKDEIPDLLALTYYAGNYNHKSTQECAMEMQDTYVRLDRSIAALLDLIDRKVGLQTSSSASPLRAMPIRKLPISACTASPAGNST